MVDWLASGLPNLFSYIPQAHPASDGVRREGPNVRVSVLTETEIAATSMRFSDPVHRGRPARGTEVTPSF